MINFLDNYIQFFKLEAALMKTFFCYIILFFNIFILLSYLFAQDLLYELLSYIPIYGRVWLLRDIS